MNEDVLSMYCFSCGALLWHRVAFLSEPVPGELATPYCVPCAREMCAEPFVADLREDPESLNDED